MTARQIPCCVHDAGQMMQSLAQTALVSEVKCSLPATQIPISQEHLIPFHHSLLFSYNHTVMEPSPVDEKPPAEACIEDVAQKPPSKVEDEDFTLEEQRKIIRRVDLRLVTMTGLAYCISLMDRTNLSMAAIAG